jgi:glycosyltransferase involved in cell wall biosynthesis
MAADLLEAVWRLLARRFSTVVVGPDLARRYSRARRLLELSVSLVRETELPDAPPERRWDGELTALSVGRLDREKNPLLLADILRLLREQDDRWRLVICGEGPLEEELRARLEALALGSHARLTGYVPHDNGLAELYRESHALLHVSWTEGVPQVLFEAFAAGLPVVATAVGGVAEAAGDAALLVGPGDPAQPAAALRRLAADPALRERLAEAGLERVRGHTIEAEAARVAAFIATGRA